MSPPLLVIQPTVRYKQAVDVIIVGVVIVSVHGVQAKALSGDTLMTIVAGQIASIIKRVIATYVTHAFTLSVKIAATKCSV